MLCIRIFSTPFSENGGEEFDPLATETDRCRLRTNNVRENCGEGAANGNTRDCNNHSFQADFSESSTATIFNTVRLSAVSATGNSFCYFKI